MKNSGIGLLCLLALCTVIFISSVTAQQMKNDNYRAEANLSDATPVVLGIMSDAQRQHSRQFKNLVRRGRIADKLRISNTVTIVDFAPLENSAPSFGTEPISNHVRKAACDSDVILVGTITSKASQLTEEGDYIFTDYTIKCDAVLKRDAIWAEQISGSVILTEPGGKIAIDGKVALIVDQQYPLLGIGQKYLFYLSHIPNSRDFVHTKGLRFLKYPTESDDADAPANINSEVRSISEGLRTFADEPCSAEKDGK